MSIQQPGSVVCIAVLLGSFSFFPKVFNKEDCMCMADGMWEGE